MWLLVSLRTCGYVYAEGSGERGAEKSRSEELGNSVPVPGIYIKNVRTFHSMPSPPELWLCNSFLPLQWEFGVWPGWRLSNRRVRRDEVKEAVGKLAPHGKNHTLYVVLWPETGCNFSNRGSHPSASSDNWKIIAQCRPLLLTPWCSGLPEIVFPERGIFKLYLT